jgi:hypothetical protein
MPTLSLPTKSRDFVKQRLHILNWVKCNLSQSTEWSYLLLNRESILKAKMISEWKLCFCKYGHTPLKFAHYNVDSLKKRLILERTLPV